jgi:hypothetical protein
VSGGGGAREAVAARRWRQRAALQAGGTLLLGATGLRRLAKHGMREVFQSLVQSLTAARARVLRSPASQPPWTPAKPWAPGPPSASALCSPRRRWPPTSAAHAPGGQQPRRGGDRAKFPAGHHIQRCRQSVAAISPRRGRRRNPPPPAHCSQVCTPPRVAPDSCGAAAARQRRHRP